MVKKLIFFVSHSRKKKFLALNLKMPARALSNNKYAMRAIYQLLFSSFSKFGVERSPKRLFRKKFYFGSTSRPIAHNSKNVTITFFNRLKMITTSGKDVIVQTCYFLKTWKIIAAAFVDK